MANTFKFIASVTLGSDTNLITFSSIPGTYDDLFIYVSARGSTSGENTLYYPFNGQTPTQNQKAKALYGTGTAGGALASISNTWHSIGVTTSNQTTDGFSIVKTYIPNYSNTSYQKTAVHTGANNDNTTTKYISFSTQSWEQTSAITTIDITIGSGNFKTGSSAYLYGISRA